MNIDKMLAFVGFCRILFDLNADSEKNSLCSSLKLTTVSRLMLFLRDEIITSGGNCTLAEAKRIVDASLLVTGF